MSYADYETLIRTDTRVLEKLKLKNLPCKSTLHNYAQNTFTLGFLRDLNRQLVNDWIKKPADLLLDASGIRIIGKSIWFCIRTKQKTLKKDCDKVHIAVSLCSLLIAEFKISNSKKNDSPFLRKMLKSFKELGLVIADLGYSNSTNAEFVAAKKGAFFCPFKKNAKPKGFNLWNKLKKLWDELTFLCKGIYNQRSKVEAVFSALKRRYGDKLNSKKWYMRRREMAMRLIAYNIRIIAGIEIAKEKNIPLWVRA